jgi:hypothetical protein
MSEKKCVGCDALVTDDRFVFCSEVCANRYFGLPNSNQIIGKIIQEVNDTPPWEYTYKQRPDDLVEIRASELEAILEAHITEAVEMALKAERSA